MFLFWLFSVIIAAATVYFGKNLIMNIIELKELTLGHLIITTTVVLVLPWLVITFFALGGVLFIVLAIGNRFKNPVRDLKGRVTDFFNKVIYRKYDNW